MFSSPDIEIVPSLTLPGPQLVAEPHCYIGVDLGQTTDYSAISILEQHGKQRTATYHCRHLERIELGTSYPLVVQRVATIANHPSIVDRSTLVIDQTGVGRPVVDMLRDLRLKAQLVAVTIHGGDQVIHESGYWHVPKRDLVSSVQVALQTLRLRIAPTLPAAETLTSELEAFQVKLSAAGHDTYGAWREGTHDDLVLSVAVALWAAEHGVRREFNFY